jgi:ribosomal protein L12E/L44/L45/RPP1/RPP2
VVLPLLVVTTPPPRRPRKRVRTRPPRRLRAREELAWLTTGTEKEESDEDMGFGLFD